MLREFTPRPWQQAAIDFGMQHDRWNLYARPGMGKTGSVLALLDAMSLTDDVWPVLVIAPMRVANSVWDGEVRKWAQFKGVRVSKILGTEQQRLDALREPADLYTIHYGLLTWLVTTLGGKWPFKTVVADESSRLKNARCSYQRHPQSGKVYFRGGGSKNASSLGSVARKSKYWINLSGTPASNGLQNLWAQQWFIDFGRSLGNSYTAFTDRWFSIRAGTSKEQAVFEPLPFASEEITDRIKNNTVSLRPEDWFALEQPRVVTLGFDLPANLYKQYKKLHAEAVLGLSAEVKITAVNAGAKSNKCLQFASGNVYDEDGKTHHIHSLKLDVLESLVEDLAGAPLLVAYHYKTDLEAIKARFPKAVALPTGARQAVVEDAWNKGEIDMLLVHPASAGHGLNLQRGGCDICIYTPTWDLELYEQVIERIGPMRQAQIGFQRIVSVYHLVARRTFDEIVAERLTTKAEVQNAILEAVKLV
jgi:hypothetical protein